LTRVDMVSPEEKELLESDGHLRHPEFRHPGNKPILNFVVWRRSSMFVLMTLALVLDVLDIYKTVIKEPQNELDLKHTKAELESYHDWKTEHGNSTFPDYIKHATHLMFNKCYSETAWIMSMKMHLQTSLKLLVLFPLFFANMRWISWTTSSNWLRAVWLITFSIPFVTQSVPSRLLINFEELIKGDVFMLKNEVTVHYNLNHTLLHSVELAANLCGDDPMGKFQGMLSNAAWAGSQAETQMNQICGFAGMLDDSPIVAQFTSWHEEARKTVQRCKVATETIEFAKKAHEKRLPQTREKMELAKSAVRDVCYNIKEMALFMGRDKNGMDSKTGQLHDLAKLLVHDGLSALSESLDTLVGAINGVASFKSLWTAALSLGPGIIKGNMRAKSIIPEASLPGAFIVVLPWIYAPLAWSLFNVIVQIFGNWALLFAAMSIAFYPIVMSLVGMAFFIGAPQRADDLTDLMKILKRVEVFAVLGTAVLAVLWVYQAYQRINQAQDEHPILKSSMEFVIKEAREAYDSGKRWATAHIYNFDALDWIMRHPIFFATCVIDTLQPAISFYMKFLVTSMVSTDWILVRVSYERRFEYLAANRECLPYDASSQEIERLQQNRLTRLDGLVVAFGGAIEETQAYDSDKVHTERAKKSRK